MPLFKKLLFKEPLSPWTACLFIIVSALVIRLLGIGFYPLQDTSEARYGEMVRLMVETNDWITPWFDYGIPFWGKPPLFIWLSALSFKIFGINEFAARLPSLICSLGVIWLTWRLTVFQLGRSQARLAVLILVSTAMFLVLSGALLAEPVMLLSITMILTAFWISWNSEYRQETRRWQYIFFIACGTALLSKGPAALVLAGLPVFFWCLPENRLLLLWKKFPWVKGTLITMLVALPWYIAAEIKTPGFLDYFIIGEHFSRYTDSGWDGDQYGNAHIRPLGIIWVRWLQGGFPWSLIIVAIGIKFLWNRFKGHKENINQWQGFLLLWLLVPLIFFTFSRNLIWTYALPVAPAMAILLATYWSNSWSNQWSTVTKRILIIATLTPVLMLIVTGALIKGLGKPSQKELIESIPHISSNIQSERSGDIIYWQSRPFSARYYSSGKALLINDLDKLQDTLDDNKRDYLVTKKKLFNQLPPNIRNHFTELREYGRWKLLEEKTKAQ